MTRISAFATATAVASLLLMGAASAQTAAPRQDRSAQGRHQGAGGKEGEKPRTAASLECSKEADAKGLHGKERKKFRSECKANADKGDKPRRKVSATLTLPWRGRVNGTDRDAVRIAAPRSRICPAMADLP